MMIYEENAPLPPPDPHWNFDDYNRKDTDMVLFLYSVNLWNFYVHVYFLTRFRAHIYLKWIFDVIDRFFQFL